MNQYRITTDSLTQISDDDCYLAPDDPLHALKAASMMGGLGSSTRLAQYNNLTQQRIRDELLDQREEAKRQGIKPGSVAWNAMFSSK